MTVSWTDQYRVVWAFAFDLSTIDMDTLPQVSLQLIRLADFIFCRHSSGATPYVELRMKVADGVLEAKTYRYAAV